MSKGKFRIDEMPKRIEPVDPEIGFTVNTANKKLASEILKSKKTTLIETTQMGNILYRYGNKFVLVDPYRVRVLYYISWRDRYYKFLNTTVAQSVLHWRDRGLFETTELSSHVFFDLLMPIHGNVMTDSLHTGPGERFWLRRIDDAFNRNLNVYCVYLIPTDNSPRKIVKATSKLSFNSLLITSDSDLSRSPWGDEDKFEARRVLISQTPLNVEVEKI